MTIINDIFLSQLSDIWGVYTIWGTTERMAIKVLPHIGDPQGGTKMSTMSKIRQSKSFIDNDKICVKSKTIFTIFT